MNLELLRAQFDLLGPNMVAVALCCARLLPVAFLCPLLGGQAAPTTVQLALVLSLALFLHQVAGVSLPMPVETPIQLAALAMKELTYGTSVGLVAALPFDAELEYPQSINGRPMENYLEWMRASTIISASSLLTR